MQLLKSAAAVVLGFVAGVLINVGIDVAGIAISGDFGWDHTRIRWLDIAIPYASALAAVLYYRRKEAETLPYAVTLLAGLAISVAAQLIVAVPDQDTDERLVAAANTTIPALASSTTHPPTTHHVATTTTLRRDIGSLRRMLLDYWNDDWVPLLNALGDAGPRDSARVACEVAKGENTRVAERLNDWKDGDLTHFAGGIFDEMKAFLNFCSQGDWEAASETYPLVASWYQRYEDCVVDSELC